ncbi:putative ATP-dependent DNA helicase II subunit 2 [Diplocarpon rosae]|nr:putative ATP-dependent DNA helicase II subunit 2 [Diplocarpon rosae]
MSKEATIFVVDLGATTAECHNGRLISDLEYGMQYVWEKIAEIMAENKTTRRVGVVGFRTDETNNSLSGEAEYENISVLKNLGAVDTASLKELRSKIVSSKSEAGDAVSAVVIAIQLIKEHTTLKTGKPGKFDRKIVLVTDGQGSIEDDDIQPIAEHLNESDIRLVVLGIDFDDAEYGFKEEDKSSVKRHTEDVLKRLTESCKDADFATVAEAIDSLATPSVKKIKIFKHFEGLGDFTKYPESAMFIDVQRYFKIKQAKPPSASNYASRAAAAPGQSFNTAQDDTEMVDAPGLATIKTSVKYQVADTTAEGGKLDVERKDLAKGYYYGSTAVPFSEDDYNTTKFESKQSLSIIGFIPSDKYERFLNMGEACITIAQPVNDKARMALSSLVHALHELDSYAVARLVPKDGKPPVIILMAPLIEPDLECLVDVPIPFAEDIRTYRFPPLDKVIGSSGAVLTKHRYLPGEKLEEAMSNYVDSMDLSTFGKGEDGEATEYMPIEDTYAPMVHRLKQALRSRVIHPDSEIGEPADVLVKWSKPPTELISKAGDQLERLKKCAEVTKVPPKKKGRRGERETITPLSKLDIDALLLQSGRKKEVSRDNAEAEFIQMLAAPDEPAIAKATNEMAGHIRYYLKTLTGNNNFGKVFSLLKAFRNEMVELEYPGIYNDFLRDLKQEVANGDFGDRREFWLGFRGSACGLIVNDLPETMVTVQEAEDFLRQLGKS